MNITFPTKILSQHVAVLGKTGSGKTSTEKLIVEQLVAQDPNCRICILDPIKSDHWGLTRAANGKDKGLPFCILGGPYGHVPLSASAGAPIGQVVASGALRLAILDMADFDMGEHAKFFIAFANGLFRNMRGVVHLLVEEAHVFAPKEKAGWGDESKSTHWMKKLATGARSKGIRMIAATQRTQELHNAVLASCESVIVHRITLPADQEPISKWLSGNVGREHANQIEATFSSLKTGEGWICSGEAKVIERREFPRIATYDNSRTPDAADSGKELRPPPVDEDALRKIIGNAVEEAKANDPAELKRTIADLKRNAALMERKLASVQQNTPEVKQERVEVPVLKASDTDLLYRAQCAFESFEREFKELGGRIGIVQKSLDNAAMDRTKPALMRQVRETLTRPTRPPSPPSQIHPSSNGAIDGPMQKILDTIAMLNRRGLTPNREMVARWMDIHPNGGRYCSNLARLREEGYLNGFDLANKVTTHEMPEGLAGCLEPLDGSSREIIETLEQNPGRTFTRETLAQILNIHPNGGRYCSNLARLRTMGLIPERGEIKLIPAAYQ